MCILNFPIKEILLDKTILNMISLLMSGAGAFSVLSQFYLPKEPIELHKTYLDSNPFAIKHSHQMSVKTLTDNLFIGMAALGLFIQIPLIIYDDEFKKISMERNYYWLIFVILFSLITLLVITVSYFARSKSKKKWFPEIIRSQRQVFEQAKDILIHDGWRTDQLDKKTKVPDPERYRKANFETAEEYILQIENLFEIKNKGKKNLTERFQKIQKYFT